MIPIIEKEKCTRCLACSEVCPPRAIYEKNKKICIKEDLCEECGFCAAECPSGAISIKFPFFEE